MPIVHEGPFLPALSRSSTDEEAADQAASVGRSGPPEEPPQVGLTTPAHTAPRSWEAVGQSDSMSGRPCCATPRMRIYHEEPFVPVVSFVEVENADESFRACSPPNTGLSARGQGVTVRRGQGATPGVSRRPAIHRRLLDLCQDLDGIAAVLAQRKRREYENRVARCPASIALAFFASEPGDVPDNSTAAQLPPGVLNVVHLGL
jgi:hypothetical protein